MKLLADLLRCSRKTLAYTGAGLSVAAGIAMAATGSGTKGKLTLEAEPTLAHRVMAQLNRRGLLHAWVQQNHDGLPQKAGYRQEDINEIHGSWYDPSNPVVKYSGTLQSDLCEDMEMQAKTADLCIVLGTSLTGLNADQCVTKTATRSTVRVSEEKASLGSVIISPQRTSQDGAATLRIFAKADEVMAALAIELGLGPVPSAAVLRQSFPKTSRVLVPYDKEGLRSDTVKTWWDLSPGAKVKIGKFHNIEGSHQPSFQHITSDSVGTVTGRDDRTCTITVEFGGKTVKLGVWWLSTALRGGVSWLPLVNVNAKEQRE